MQDNLPINRIGKSIKLKNRVVFKIKICHKLKLLSNEPIKLLGSTEKVIAKDKNSENVRKLENVDVTT